MGFFDKLSSEMEIHLLKLMNINIRWGTVEHSDKLDNHIM